MNIININKINIHVSRFNDIMTKGRGEEFGKTAYSYAMEIITEMLTGEKKELILPALDWGNAYERDAIEAYQLVTFNQVKEAETIKINGISGRPDGYVLDGICEIKCPFNPQVHLYNLIHREVPKEYIPQIQGYFWLTELTWCDFVSYSPIFPKKNQLMIVRTERNDEYIKELYERIEKFKEIIKNLLNKI